jgi:hypothetical protein
LIRSKRISNDHASRTTIAKKTYSLYYYTHGDPSTNAIIFFHPAYGSNSIFGDNSAIKKAQNREILKAFFLMLFGMDGFRRYVFKNTNVVESEREVFIMPCRS